MIKVIAIEDHALILRSIEEILKEARDIRLVDQDSHASRLLPLVRSNPGVNVVILDLGMPAGEPFNPVIEIARLKDSFPDVHILVLSGEDNTLMVQKVVEAGAEGYLLKDGDLSLRLPDAVRAVARSQRYYSSRVLDRLFETSPASGFSGQELDIQRKLAEGYSNRGIAEAVNLTEKRIRNLLPTIYQKLGVDQVDRRTMNLRVMAANRARALGVID